MKFYAVMLEFTTPLHIGRGWGELDKSEPLLHSDTLKSALFSVIIQFKSEWRNKANDFFNGFSISSCFPYYKDEFFLPKLLLNKKIIINGIEEYKQIKVSNKIEYLSVEVFNKYINSENKLEIDKDQLSKNQKYVFSKKLDNPFDFIKNETQQRVRIENYSSSMPFFVDRIFFEKDSGLYFLIKFNDENIKDEIFFALKLLGACGVGTDRTVGNGFFEFDEKKHVREIDIECDNIKANAFASLGLYLPKREELESFDLEKSLWNLKERGGYMAGSEFIKFRHLLKTPIHMFTEGSVFYVNKLPVGRLENLKPFKWNDEDMHDVYRCGQPIFIPVKI